MVKSPVMQRFTANRLPFGSAWLVHGEPQMTFRDAAPAKLLEALFVVVLLGLAWNGFVRPAFAEPSLSRDRVAILDAHALAAPVDVEQSAERLAAYLTSITHNDAEKARVIFRWVADRIDYDVNAYLTDQLSVATADSILQSRSSVCDGYATLFQTLADEAGLEAVSITGYAKAYGHANKAVFDKRNHAWNAVRIDGQWRLVDATWGAGAVRNGKYVKALSEIYFLADPDRLAFSHFPEDARWQMQTMPKLDKTSFEALPRLEPGFFHLGIPGKAVWETLHGPGFDGKFARTFDIPYGTITVIQAPLTYHLTPGKAYELDIRADDMEDMAIIHNGRWTHLPRAGGRYHARFSIRGSGEVSIAGKTRGNDRFTTFLQYQVD